MSLGNTNLPPGVSAKHIEGEPCPTCGERGCDCEPEETLTRREVLEIDKAEARADYEKENQ